MQSCGKLGLGGRSRLPALQRGRGACQKSRDQTRKRDQKIKLESAPKTNHTGVSSHSGPPWVLGQATSTLTHKTHHNPDSGEATTFLHIVFSTPLRGGYIQMALFPGTPKLESRNCPGWSPGTLGAHISRLPSLIKTRSKPKLQLSSRAFQRHVVLPIRMSATGRFPTFSGRESNCKFDSRAFFCP